MWMKPRWWWKRKGHAGTLSIPAASFSTCVWVCVCALCSVRMGVSESRSGRRANPQRPGILSDKGTRWHGSSPGWRTLGSPTPRARQRVQSQPETVALGFSCKYLLRRKSKRFLFLYLAFHICMYECIYVRMSVCMHVYIGMRGEFPETTEASLSAKSPHKAWRHLG